MAAVHRRGDEARRSSQQSAAENGGNLTGGNNMNIFIVSGITGVAGIGIGAIGHAYFSKKAAASKAELFAWAQELRTVVITDAQAAKTKIEALALKIENKL
jgi:Leu/Phe-tRNA-protein transferase